MVRHQPTDGMKAVIMSCLLQAIRTALALSELTTSVADTSTIVGNMSPHGDTDNTPLTQL